MQLAVIVERTRTLSLATGAWRMGGRSETNFKCVWFISEKVMSLTIVHDWPKAVRSDNAHAYSPPFFTLS